MSNLENLKKALADEAAAQAAAVKAEAERRAEALRAEAAERAEGLRAEALAAARRESERLRRQAEAEERLLRRQKLLAAKAELVGRVMETALQRLVELPEEEYRALLLRLFVESAPEGRVAVALNRRDRERLGQAFLRRAEAELSAHGRRVELSLAPEPAGFKGGFQLKAEGFEVDCAMESLLQREADALEPEVARVLFG